MEGIGNFEVFGKSEKKSHFAVEKKKEIFEDEKMLVSFSITNFHSFGKKQTFTMLANSREKLHNNRPLQVDSFRIQKLATIYGPNASGKSNFVLALHVIKEVFAKKQPITSAYVSNWLIGKKTRSSPSKFDLIIYTSNKFYNYGFEFDMTTVYKEWLYDLGADGKKNEIVFDRKTTLRSDNTKKTNVKYNSISSENSENSTFLYAQAFGQSGELFLNHLDSNIETHTDKRIKDVLDWLKLRLLVISAKTICTIFPHLEVKAKEIQYNDSLSKMGLDIYETKVLSKDVSMIYNNTNINSFPEQTILTQTSNTSRLLVREIRRDSNNKLISKELVPIFKDIKGEEIKIPVDYLSTGTQRAMFLNPLLLDKAKDTIIIIDELDSALHPDLFIYFVEKYAELNRDSSQLIFTAHNTVLLDKDILRSDEVWFLDKKNKQSFWNPLYQYKIRKDLKKGKSYLEGRFESLPNIKI